MIVTRWPRVLQPSLHHKIQFEDNKNIIDGQWELGSPTLFKKLNNWNANELENENEREKV